MDIIIGDYVTRNSYNNDTIFKVINIENNIYYLKGVDVRLYADSELSDLCKCDYIEDKDRDINKINKMNPEYFYMPAKILHIDGDEEYLERCINFYKKNDVYAVGKRISEDVMHEQVEKLLIEYNPDILIITGHDAYLKNNGDIDNVDSYKNSYNFVKAVKRARSYEKSHDKLIIIAGACQSNYESLIKAGANFASSPKRVNIHALDPAIIAITIALTTRGDDIDIKNLLEKTKYGSDGMGGMFTKGLMYVGYPRG